jgi:hypothetical protein
MITKLMCGIYLLDKDIRGPTAFKNSMVWLAVEICAQELAAQEAA